MDRQETLAGNAAMRKALEKIVRIAEEWDTPGIHAVQATLYRILEAARAALAAPARNCDVGTAKEQTERFEAFCQSNMQFYKDMFGHDDEGRLDGWDCRKDCPVGRMIDAGEAVSDHCQLAWAQMPYEAE